MQRPWILVTAFLFSLSAGTFLGRARTANAESPSMAPARSSAPVEMAAKKCNFDSDCPFGKCGGGQCGTCNFDSDCKGWGRCKSGHCGACNFDSDCKDFGGCKSGSCGKSPW